MTDQVGIAVVTGAGRGLGRALSCGLVAKGVTVAGIGRDAQSLEETRQHCADPDSFHAIVCDLADFAAVKDAFDRIRRIAPVSILINNAAVYPRRDILDETPESLMHTVNVNLGGVVACSRYALDDMVETGTGRIVNVISFADANPIPASAGYAVSKGAMRIMTRALVADICDRFPGIVINDWAPGILKTRLGMPTGLDPDLSARWGVQLALSQDLTLSGTVWERDTELLEPRSLKRRVFDAVTLRRPQKPRRLDS